MNTVSLEAARLLKEAGFSQNQWPQMVWHLARDEGGNFLEYWPLTRAKPLFKYIAAPDLLTALDWLEREKGWRIGKSCHPNVSPKWCAHEPSLPVFDGRGFWSPCTFEADTADALILKVCERITNGGDTADQ